MKVLSSELRSGHTFKTPRLLSALETSADKENCLTMLKTSSSYCTTSYSVADKEISSIKHLTSSSCCSRVLFKSPQGWWHQSFFNDGLKLFIWPLFILQSLLLQWQINWQLYRHANLSTKFVFWIKIYISRIALDDRNFGWRGTILHLLILAF
jgi:hypothetical protein